MKKLILAAILIISSLQFATAQQESFDELFNEMQKMQQEMLKQFGDMDLSNQGFQFFMDTTIIQGLGDLDIDFNDQLLQQLDPSMFEGLFGQMQEELSKMDEEDWAELEKLFKNFEGFMPFPNLDNPNPNDQPTKKDKKKRKIYKM